MSDHDRGAYTPPSDRLSFDPREPVRSGGPAPVTLIVSGLVLVVIIGGVFLLYSGGTRRKGDAPALVGAPIAQIKTPAPPDASNDVPAGLVIDKNPASNMAAANTAPAFAPPPEEPLPRPLPVQAAPVVETLPPPPPRAAPPPTASHPAAPPVKPVTIASLTDAALAQKPAAKLPPPPAAPPTLAIPPAPVVATTAATPPAGQGWVQIGAYSSATLADKGWSDVAHLSPGPMSGKGKRVEQLSKDGKTLYRTYITGFPSRGDAQAFCEKLKAGGKACFVK